MGADSAVKLNTILWVAVEREQEEAEAIMVVTKGGIKLLLRENATVPFPICDLQSAV